MSLCDCQIAKKFEIAKNGLHRGGEIHLKLHSVSKIDENCIVCTW